MEPRAAGADVTIGTEVFASDGEKIGEVAAVHPAYVVVERGLLFPDDFYVPRSAIRVDGDRLTLGIASGELDRQGWNEPPAGADPDQETAIFATGERVHLDVDDDGTAGRG